MPRVVLANAETASLGKHTIKPNSNQRLRATYAGIPLPNDYVAYTIAGTNPLRLAPEPMCTHAARLRCLLNRIVVHPLWNSGSPCDD